MKKEEEGSKVSLKKWKTLQGTKAKQKSKANKAERIIAGNRANWRFSTTNSKTQTKNWIGLKIPRE